MASTLQLSVALANLIADAVGDALTGGYLQVYSGTQPTTADTAVSTQVLLAEKTVPVFSAPATGTVTASTLGGTLTGLATGIPTWYRLVSADRATTWLDGSVGTANADLVLDRATITQGEPVTIQSFAVTMPRSV